MSTCTLTCAVVLPPSPKRWALLLCPLLPSGMRGCFAPFSQVDMMAAVLFFFRFGYVLASFSVPGRSSEARFGSLGSPGESWGLIFAPRASSGGSSGDLWASREGPWGILGRPWWVPGGSLGSQGGSWGALGAS